MALTLVKAISKPTEVVISTDLLANIYLNSILLNIFLQYINNSTTNKPTNYYSDFLAVADIVLNGKNMTHIEAQSFELS